METLIKNGSRVKYWSMYRKEGTVRGSDIWFLDGKPGIIWYVVENDRGVLWPVREDYVKRVVLETELC